MIKFLGRDDLYDYLTDFCQTYYDGYKKQRNEYDSESLEYFMLSLRMAEIKDHVTDIIK